MNTITDGVDSQGVKNGERIIVLLFSVLFRWLNGRLDVIFYLVLAIDPNVWNNCRDCRFRNIFRDLRLLFVLSLFLFCVFWKSGLGGGSRSSCCGGPGRLCGSGSCWPGGGLDIWFLSLQEGIEQR